MLTELEYYFLLFFIGSVAGWCMEVICKLIQFRRFINRGFLIGPYCPIYGCGTVMLTLSLSGFTDQPLAVFGLAILICGGLEYVTSWAMEKLFNARWWDYSQKRFNLNGRVCADTLIPFGLLGLTMIYFVKPTLFGLFARMSAALVGALCISLSALMLADAVISAFTLGKIRAHATRAAGDSTEAITAAVRETLLREGALLRRQLRAFPEAKIYNGRVAKLMRERRRQMRADLQAARQRARQALEQSEQQVRAEMKKLREKRDV